MPYEGQFDLVYENKKEEREFVQTRRLNGFHISVVKKYYEEEAYQNIMGSNWTSPEPKGRGILGVWGMDLRYAPLDPWYKEGAVKKGRFTADEVDNFWAAWKSKCKIKKPLTAEELFDHWKTTRKKKAEAEQTNKRKRERRYTKSWEKKFQAERDPNLIYRRLIAAIPSRSVMDEQILRSFARMLGEANGLLWQAEQLKNDEGLVHEERIQDYAKLIDLTNKIQKQVNDLLKSHGYDYQARRSRRESQTAAEVFDEFVEQAAVLFDQRATEFTCVNCKESFGYFIRHFPTMQIELYTPSCPKCGRAMKEVMEPAPDEVVDA